MELDDLRGSDSRRYFFGGNAFLSLIRDPIRRSTGSHKPPLAVGDRAAAVRAMVSAGDCCPLFSLLVRRSRILRCRVIVPHVKQRGLGFSRRAEFVLFMLGAGFGLILFSLDPSLSLVSLSLLPRLLFLTLGKCRSASWHTHPPWVWISVLTGNILRRMAAALMTTELPARLASLA